MKRHSVTVLAFLALLFVGCGNTGGEGSSSTVDADGAETLSEFLGFGDEDPEAAEARYRDEEAERQELIRSCMSEEGFDYIPVMPPEQSFQVFGPEGEEERVAEQGFGISTWYGNEEEFSGPDIEWTDPNQDMVETMSESEQQAYYESLYGSEEEQMEGATTEVDPETGEEMVMMEGFGAGCEGEASEAIYGDQAQNELWEELGPAMETMYEQIQADPRVVEFNENWSTCMGEAGFEFASQEDMYNTVFDDFQTRLEAIVGPNGGYADPFEGWTEDEINAFFEEKTEDEINAFFEQAESETRADIDQEALTALQQEEIDLAVADFECRDGFEDLYEEVSADYEPAFIESHRETLEKIRDAQGG